MKHSELDREGFDAESYVQGLLEREGLDGVLKVEGGLVNGGCCTCLQQMDPQNYSMSREFLICPRNAEIKGLDGERKALVYDNYSKLIAATDTIRKVYTRIFAHTV